MSETLYFIVDLRPSWRRDPWLMLWGADNSGYRHSVSQAGRYTSEQLTPGYHYKHAYGSTRGLLRFPVACATVERFAVPVPADDPRWRGYVGPSVPNTGPIRHALRRARLMLGDPSAFDARATEAA